MAPSRPRLWSTIVLATALTGSACGSNRSPSPTQPTPDPGATARAYLDTVIALMQENSVNRLIIDWNAFRSAVVAAAPGAQTIADLNPAIRKALELLGDGHSSYRSVAGTVLFVGNRSCAGPAADVPTVPPTVGYVKVAGFSGDAAAATVYADGLQAAIKAADRDDLAGWIVDVRGSGGGNMWPMIAGVGPVLGEGTAGHFIGPTGFTNAWGYRDGGSWAGSGTVVHQVSGPYRLRRERPRVAVLTDIRIASSGEAVVVAFRQRPDTRSFGTPTCGLSTANTQYRLNDGATLTLTVAVMADRTRTKYGDTIVPDEVVTDPGETVQRAIAWLTSGT